MKNLIYIMLFFIFLQTAFSQAPLWHTLPNAPYTLWHYDDLSFINENTGWVVYNTAFGAGDNGRVYKTTDGGNSWAMQMSVSNIDLRCIGFTDSLNGWI